MNVRLTSYLIHERAALTAGLMCAGTMQIMAYGRPESPDLPRDRAAVLVSVRFSRFRKDVRAEGATIIAQNFEKAIVSASGTPIWWCVASATGNALCDGLVGDGLTLEEDKLWQGMELELETFKYRLILKQD